MPTKSTPKKIMKYLIIALLVLGAGWLGWHFLAGSTDARATRSNQSETIVAAVEATRGDLARTITLTAEFLPFQQIEVHSKVAGFVKTIPVDIGDRVKAGDVLATLEIPELEQDLKKAQAAVDAARQGVKQAEANYQVAHTDFTRLQQVAKDHPKLVAQQELDTVSGKDQAAAAALASARQHVEEAQAEQSRQLAMVDYSRITAPFEGVITRRFADVGALIQAGTGSGTTAVVSLAQENVLRVMFPVPESAVAAVTIDKPVQIQVSGLDRSVRGKVTRFSRQINRETRTMETEVDVPNDDLSITPGMYGWAELTLEERKDALNVPVQAVSSGDHPTVLLVNKNHELEERLVKVGLVGADQVEILEGLHPNDLVFIGNRSQVHAGMRVQPKVVDGVASTEKKNG